MQSVVEWRATGRKAYGSFFDLQAPSLHVRIQAVGKPAKPFHASFLEFRGLAAKGLGNDFLWCRFACLGAAVNSA